MNEMNEGLDTAAKYRRRAQELRQIAEAIEDEASRKPILEIADDYEKLARSRAVIDTIGRQSRLNRRNREEAPAQPV